MPTNLIKSLKIIHFIPQVITIHADKIDMSKMLSKSKIKDNSKCSLMLWHGLNQPKLKEWSVDNQKRFDQGREVEAIARNMFPNAILQDKDANLDKIAYTQEILRSKKTIFEAAFLYENTIIQFDMLTENPDGSFNAVEVKSSTSFKSDYVLDVIVQYWVATKAGIKINKFEVWYVNNGSNNKDDYFSSEDVTNLVRQSEDVFTYELNAATDTFKMEEAPKVLRSSNCDKIECAFKNTPQCKLQVENKNQSVFALPRFRQNWEAYHAGNAMVDETFKTKYSSYYKKNPLIVESVLNNKLVINQKGIEEAISQWVMPYNFFDFETLMRAIPILDKQKPYEQVVFQFSNHIYHGQDKLEHQMFLHETLECPDMQVIAHLLSFLNNKGSIIVYNKTFEETRIKELAAKYPEHTASLMSLIPRFEDLMEVIKEYVYHPEFAGSYSLKKVSPALLKEFGSYSDSLIKSGAEIADYYSEMLTTQDPERKELIKKALFKYCQYDTLNLFLLLKFLLNQNVNLEEIVKANL